MDDNKPTIFRMLTDVQKQKLLSMIFIQRIQAGIDNQRAVLYIFFITQIPNF